jgi:hypothetical protein
MKQGEVQVSIKTVKKLGVSGVMLSAAKDAEASLAREESRSLEQGLPEGHPLRNEAEKQKAMLGDLSGLPPGHPLLRAMQAAKERYEQQQNQKEDEQKKTSVVRKAHRVDADEARREARRVEDERNERLVEAANHVNAGLAGALGEIKKLYKVMSDHEGILNNDPLCRVKVGRLKRLLFAAERGFSESRLSKARV